MILVRMQNAVAAGRVQHFPFDPSSSAHSVCSFPSRRARPVILPPNAMCMGKLSDEVLEGEF